MPRQSPDTKDYAPVPIILDKPRTIKFYLQALEAIEEATDMYIHEFWDTIDKENPWKMKTVRILLWAGLLHEDPKLTMADVQNMVAAKDVFRVKDAIVLAMNQDLILSEEGEAGKN